MSDVFKPDDYIEDAGQHGNGYSRIYDRKTGRCGYYDHNNKWVHLDPEKKKDDNPEPVKTSAPLLNNDYFAEAEEERRQKREKRNKVIKSAAIIGASAVAAKIAEEKYENNGSSRLGRNLACIIGIIAILAFLALLTVVFIFILSPNNVTDIILISASVIGYGTIFGLIRVMLNKPFFIFAKRNYSTKHKPKYIYVIVMIASVILSVVSLINPIDIACFDYCKNVFGMETIQNLAFIAAYFLVIFIAAAIPGVVVGLIINLIIKKV